MDYNILKPRNGYIVLKNLEDESNGKILIKSGNEESRAMGKVIATTPSNPNFNIGDLVVYNEYEGQELFKYQDMITEDGIIVLKEENILLKIDEYKQ